jgi:hypothetical protein
MEIDEFASPPLGIFYLRVWTKQRVASRGIYGLSNVLLQGGYFDIREDWRWKKDCWCGTQRHARWCFGASPVVGPSNLCLRAGGETVNPSNQTFALV